MIEDAIECENCKTWLESDVLEENKINILICDNCLHPNYFTFNTRMSVEEFLQQIRK